MNDKRPPSATPHSYIVRVWYEHLEGNRAWRLAIQRIPEDEWQLFTSFQQVQAFMLAAFDVSYPQPPLQASEGDVS
jgi:hypothetical protein